MIRVNKESVNKEKSTQMLLEELGTTEDWNIHKTQLNNF